MPLVTRKESESEYIDTSAASVFLYLETKESWTTVWFRKVGHSCELKFKACFHISSYDLVIFDISTTSCSDKRLFVVVQHFKIGIGSISMDYYDLANFDHKLYYF